MNLYLDDDSSHGLLVRLLRRDGHGVVTSADMGMLGREDPAHFIRTIQVSRILVTHNHDDFFLLHTLVLASGGHHPGVLAVRRDNDKTKDMKVPDIARAIRKLVAAGIPLADELIVLNHWR